MLTDEQKWEAVRTNDAGFDGRFVYAVKTTSIYCRPSCRSRLPNRENIVFNATPAEAEAAGFRACKRCNPAEAASPEIELVQAICARIEGSLQDGGETLADLSAAFHLSESRLQRSFKAVMGISPREYSEALRIRALKEALRTQAEVLDAAASAGFRSASQLYTRLDDLLAMTPSAYRAGGVEGIRFAVADSALGFIIAAATERGICAIRLGDDPDELIGGLLEEYPGAEMIGHDPFLEWALTAVMGHLAGELPHINLPLDIRMTAFQKRVWDELRKIPAGQHRAYGEIAESIGQPGASRAVGSACAANPVAIIIPCHRATRSDGSTGGYRWGAERKRDLLALEGMG